MPKGMLGEALQEITGLLWDLFSKLSGDQGAEWLEALKRFLRKENPWPMPPGLLEQIATVVVSAIPSFDAGAHFVIALDKDCKSAEVRIGRVSDNVRCLVKGFVEPEVAAATLRFHKLVTASPNCLILSALGGEEVALTTWGQIYEEISRQGRGQGGVLLTNGNSNVFYVRQKNGEIWAVHCIWDSSDRYWSVYAYPLMYLSEWHVGTQIVSC